MKSKGAGILLVWLLCGAVLQAAGREEQWREVKKAIQGQLPRTAATNLDAILSAALQEKAYAEAARAVAQRVVVEGEMSALTPSAQIQLLQSKITNGPPEMVPVLRSIEAQWTAGFAKGAAWRFSGRTTVTGVDDQDLATWDLPRLFAEIDRKFALSLEPAAELQRIPIAQFDTLFERGDMPDAYRPTLYDFLAHEALEFYGSWFQLGARPENWQDFPTDQLVYGVIPLFGTVEEFLAGSPERKADALNAEKALFLFRDLLRFHLKDADPTALIHADLARLKWAYKTAVGDAKRALYCAALERLGERWRAQPIVTEVYFERADWARWTAESDPDGGLLREAWEWAGRGGAMHPESRGAKQCRALIAELESPALHVTSEYVWNSNPVVQATHKNLAEAHFRAFRIDIPDLALLEEPAAILARNPAKRWSVALPATPDFKAQRTDLTPPSDLPQGLYAVVASMTPDATGEEDVIMMAVCVSDLAVVVRSRLGNAEGLVVDAISGEPVAGAEVTLWMEGRGDDGLRRGPRTRSGPKGLFVFKGLEESVEATLQVRLGRRELVVVASSLDCGEDGDVRTTESRAVLFTDRTLYRPGQPIQYKGICVTRNGATGIHQVMKGGEAVVILNDSNGREITRQAHRCNAFGSFSGCFVAPTNRLTGTMEIVVRGCALGDLRILVEEYKRPKFKATLDAPATPPRLGEPVTLSGRADTLAGAPVDGAVITWSVERSVRWPEWVPWWSWDGDLHSEAYGERKRIAHGTGVTAQDGTFQITFPAESSLAISPTNEPVFEFSVSATVTDPAGETQSAERTVVVGHAAIAVTVSAEPWQTPSRPVELAVRSSSLDGAGVSTEGVLRVFRVEQPDRVVRPAPRPFLDYDGDPSEVTSRGGEAGWDICRTWPTGEQIMQRPFRTDGQGKDLVEVELAAGVYRVVVESQDRHGTPVKGMTTVLIADPEATRLGIRVPSLLTARTWTVEPGQEFTALWGTGYDVGRAFVEVEHRGRLIQRFWTQEGRTQQPIRVRVTEAMRGGFTVYVTQVRENRVYLQSHAVEVPWSNKELHLKWEHFVSKMQPGQKETWSLVIQPPTNRVSRTKPLRFAAEMVATLYDGALDMIERQNWPKRFDILVGSSCSLVPQSMNGRVAPTREDGITRDVDYVRSYAPRRLPETLVRQVFGRRWSSGDLSQMMCCSVGGPTIGISQPKNITPIPPLGGGYVPDSAVTSHERPLVGLNLGLVVARKNLNETAFFFPHLQTGTNGEVRMTFTMPEALTTWKFLGFAHDRELRSGYLEAEAVTAKDLMVQPNPPRFLREGDELEFAVKVSNQSTNRQTGKVQLSLRYAATDASADRDLKLEGVVSSGRTSGTELTFDIPAKESRTFSWRLKVPDGCGFLAYKAVGSTGKMSDGEEGWLPVLPRRILVTESLPLPIRGKPGGGDVTKEFELEKLVKSGRSSTLKHQGYTVQMVSQPAWYAVMALPYLMEFPHECSEQTFNRYYANALARHIALKDPKIRRIFDLWKGTEALDSPLEKNAELKSVILEETPWVRQAQKESEARRSVGVLFDANRLENEQARTLQKLAEAQGADGLWPWFPGGRGNDYITLYIVTGFGRLRHLETDIQVGPAVKAMARLDTWMEERYREILKQPKPTDHVPGSTECLYLYGRSFFLKDKSLADGAKEAVEFFQARARAHWAKVESRQNQGHLALALHRFGGEENVAAAQAIARSLKERAVRSEEMGMFWRETELSWWWYRAPIETQAMMIEVFDEVAGDRDAVEECRVWLLKQKQTQDWKTTKATADAVYGLLLRGGNLLGSDRLVEVKVGGMDVTPGQAKTPGTSQPEAGTGFYERRFGAGEVKASMGEITVRKVDEGVSWGSVHWQYWEDMAKVTAYEGTPLKLKKSVYRRVDSGKGPVLEAVKGAWAVGDEMVVRVELRVDRDMEYVHLKDQRGSGTEPVNVLSGYRFQDGLRYYESTRDTASHFYIDYLPKGTYVFEYATRVQQRGQYQTGMASIQCMYAPEFNSHSESIELTVK